MTAWGCRLRAPLSAFHSICVKLLRRHADLGIESNFTILDTEDKKRLIKQLILANNIDEKRWPARQMGGIMTGKPCLTPEKVPSAEAGAFNNRGTEIYAYKRGCGN